MGNLRAQNETWIASKSATIGGMHKVIWLPARFSLCHNIYKRFDMKIPFQGDRNVCDDRKTNFINFKTLDDNAII